MVNGPAGARGRPRGRTAELAAPQAVLRPHHFSYLRALAEGIGLRPAWERYMAFTGGPDDERHFAAQTRRLRQQVGLAARAFGLEAAARVALGEAPRPAQDELPTLENWIATQADAEELDPGDRSEAEWLQAYHQAFGLDRAPLPRAASATPPIPRAEPLQALNRLAAALARPPSLDDPLSQWLAPGLAAALQAVGVRGLRDLAAFMNLHGQRWHRLVPGVGATRATHLAAWLQPLAETLGEPLQPQALQPAAQRALAQAATRAAVSDASFGLVPLERLAVPPALDGRGGTFRVAAPNVLGADTDLEAVRAWLARYARSPRTLASYTREVERFYLWCLLVRRKPLSSLTEDDLHAWRAFLASPPADWVQHRQEPRDSAHWRPFRGPLSPLSQRHAMTVVAALLGALVKAGYLSASAAGGVVPLLKLPRPGIDMRRSFDEAQWRWLMRCWDEAYAEAGAPGGLADPGPDRQPARARSLRRLRLVLELGATTGLRLIELATARLAGLRREVVDGQAVWLLEVLGKGHRRRQVLVFDDIHALIERHQADLRAAGLGPDPQAPLRTLTTPLGAAGRDPHAGAADADEAEARPLIGALRPALPRWTLDATGQPVLDRRRRQADRWGALEPSALYQSLKRFLRQAAQRAQAQGAPLDGEAFARASTHWLRHFFANNAAADGVLPVALMGAMGHADLKTTSLYTRPEQQLLLREMGKVRRRG